MKETIDMTGFHMHPVTEATPTPQAQAGDALAAVSLAIEDAYSAAADKAGVVGLLPEALAETLAVAAIAAIAAIAQAPARDAGAVAWRFRKYDDAGVPMGFWSLTHDESMAKHQREVFGYTVEPLYTHPATASDDAREVLYFDQHPEPWANAIYNYLCAADTQDVPVEELADGIVAALAKSGYAVVPCALPPEVLGEAATGPFMEQGNPRFLWDFLLAKTRAYFTSALRAALSSPDGLRKGEAE